jgi:Uma2 family endonuclease
LEETVMAQQTTLPPLVRGRWVPMTSEEFDAWVPEGMQAEWVDGEGIIFVTTSAWHVQVGLFLKRLISTYLQVFDLGVLFDAPFEMRVREGGSRREPDLLVVLNAHRDRIRRHWLDGPADLIIELTSEYSGRIDRVDKLREYEAAGVPEHVLIDIVDRGREVEFYRLNAAGRFEPVRPDERGRYRSTVLPGFWLDPAWFRQDPLPDPDDIMLEIAPAAYAARLLAKLRAHANPNDRM